jgi:tRNA(Ile)-lysidine synthase
MDFISRIKENIGNFIQKGDTILVGVSGGPDSTALLHILMGLKKEYRLRLIVAHFNHKLRGKASEADAVFVKKLADSYGLDFIKAESDTRLVAAGRKGGLEKVAREERYVFFIKSALSFGAKKIALAHTKDEDIETILFRFIKGAGAHGLSGIPDVRKVYEGEFGLSDIGDDLYIIRPLINEYKSEIIAYFKQHNLKYRTDASNEKNIYTRNKIRNVLIPLIEKEFNPNFKESISNMAAILEAENDYFELITDKIAQREIREDAEDEISISARALKKMHPAVRSRVIMAALQRILDHHRKIKFPVIRNIEAVLAGRKNMTLPEKFDCYIESGRLWFDRKEPLAEKVNKIKINNITGVDIYDFGGRRLRFSVVKNTGRLDLKDKRKAYIDSEKARFPLFIRRRREGDRFMPYGMDKSVKLKKFINTSKIKSDPIIVTDRSRIMWIAGARLDGRFSVSQDTRRILLVELV